MIYLPIYLPRTKATSKKGFWRSTKTRQYLWKSKGVLYQVIISL